MATPASGEVLLFGGPDGRVARLVRTAGIVCENAGVSVALIGGLAVLCRVPDGAQRATQDVDLVSDESAEVVAVSGAAADNLVAANLGRRDSPSTTRLIIGDTTVEIIETTSVTTVEAASVEPDRARLFVLAHRWALEAHNRSAALSRAFADGPAMLGALAASALDRMFRSAVTQTRRWVIAYGEPAWSDILTEEALIDLATEFIDGLP